MQYIVPVLFLILFSCKTSSEDTKAAIAQSEELTSDSSFVWTKLLDSAKWGKNYNFQMFSHNDTLWTFHHDGNWQSIDGINWVGSDLPNAIFNLAFLDYVQFNGAIYGLGYFKENIEEYEFRSEIYKTTNFKTWTTISKSSNLPNRFFHHPFLFDGKVWIIGGEDRNTKYSDIWNSEDGITWIKQKDDLPFGKQSGSQIVILKDNLYLLDNDVWSSTDGRIWQLVTDQIIQGEQIFGYSAQVFDDKIWLLGCNRNGQFTSQVLYSSDGKEWQTHSAPWLPRGGVAATVHHERVYMTGGKYGGTPNHPDFRYDNDLWVLEKK